LDDDAGIFAGAFVETRCIASPADRYRKYIFWIYLLRPYNGPT